MAIKFQGKVKIGGQFNDDFSNKNPGYSVSSSLDPALIEKIQESVKEDEENPEEQETMEGQEFGKDQDNLIKMSESGATVVSPELAELSKNVPPDELAEFVSKYSAKKAVEDSLLDSGEHLDEETMEYLKNENIGKEKTDQQSNVYRRRLKGG